MESPLLRLLSFFRGADSAFSFVLFVCLALFVAGEIYFVLRFRRVAASELPKDDRPLRFLWTLVPALALASLFLVKGPAKAKLYARQIYEAVKSTRTLSDTPPASAPGLREGR